MQVTVNDEMTLDLAEKTVGMLFKAYREKLSDNKYQNEGDNKNNSSKPELENDDPVQLKETLIKKEPEPVIRSNNGKWQIPFHFKTQAAQYQHAYGICRKHKLPYPEAIQKEKEGHDRVIEQNSAENLVQSLPPGWKEIIHQETKDSPTDTPATSTETIPAVQDLPAVPQEDDIIINIKGLDDDLINTLPDTRPPSNSDKGNLASQEKRAEQQTYELPVPVQDISSIPSTQIIVGKKVKQIKADRGQIFYGNGTVLARERNGEIISVRDGGGKIHKVDAKCLVFVPEAE